MNRMKKVGESVADAMVGSILVFGLLFTVLACWPTKANANWWTDLKHRFCSGEWIDDQCVSRWRGAPVAAPAPAPAPTTNTVLK